MQLAKFRLWETSPVYGSMWVSFFTDHFYRGKRGRVRIEIFLAD